MALRGIVPGCADRYQQALEEAAAKKRRPGNGPGPPFLCCLPPPRSPLGLPEFLLRGHSLLGPTRHEGWHGLLLPSADLPGDLGASPQLPPQYLPSNLGGDPGWQGSCQGRGLCVGRGFFTPKDSLSPQSVITKVAAAHDRQLLWKANVGFVIRLQARLRGFLVRQKFAERSHFLRTLLPAIIKIQVAAVACPMPGKIGNTGCPPSSPPPGWGWDDSWTSEQ